jgi:hypothetical protein
MNEPTVKISVELSEAEAWAFAQFLKRAGHGDYRGFTRDDEEAYQMLYAAEKVRASLAEAGIAPR